MPPTSGALQGYDDDDDDNDDDDDDVDDNNKRIKSYLPKRSVFAYTQKLRSTFHKL